MRSGFRPPRDPGLDGLLDLDGQILVVDEKGDFWVKFEVRRVAVTPERPHGLHYSLTLHGKDNERLVGFDNAHPVRSSSRPGGKGQRALDHKHRLRTVRPYGYKDAAALLADFWAEVDAVLKSRGVVK
ncbi:MAG: toxin-antitoxin system TumE family protein [Bryobacteraceae bacterium]